MGKGRFYGVGIGPGDPELVTLKAVNTVKKCNIIAVPGTEAKEALAYRIAEGVIPEISDKTVIAFPMPMERDKESLGESHLKNAEKIADLLKKGEDVAFLTLGDPGIYSTFFYLCEILKDKGYDIEIISGVSSFSAAAAKLLTSLGQWDASVHIMPAKQFLGLDEPSKKDTYVIMKPRGDINALKEKLKNAGMEAKAVENCGLDGEKIYNNCDEIPDEMGYFTVIIAKRGILR